MNLLQRIAAFLGREAAPPSFRVSCKDKKHCGHCGRPRFGNLLLPDGLPETSKAPTGAIFRCLVCRGVTGYLVERYFRHGERFRFVLAPKWWAL